VTIAVAGAALAFPAAAGADASPNASCVGQLASGPAPPGSKAAFVRSVPQPRGPLVSAFAQADPCPPVEL
jgi:hypothetical protein